MAEEMSMKAEIPDLLETQQFTQSFILKLMQPKEEEKELSQNPASKMYLKKPMRVATQGEPHKKQN